MGYLCIFVGLCACVVLFVIRLIVPVYFELFYRCSFVTITVKSFAISSRSSVCPSFSHSPLMRHSFHFSLVKLFMLLLYTIFWLLSFLFSYPYFGQYRGVICADFFQFARAHSSLHPLTTINVVQSAFDCLSIWYKHYDIN